MPGVFDRVSLAKGRGDRFVIDAPREAERKLGHLTREGMIPYSDNHGRVINVGCVLRASNQFWSSWSDAGLSCANAEWKPKKNVKNTAIKMLRTRMNMGPIFPLAEKLLRRPAPPNVY